MGDKYRDYMRDVPGFVPRIGGGTHEVPEARASEG
jgi:hypothetical protein